MESRRKFQRHGCSLPVRYFNGQPYSGHVKDISAGGSFVIPAHMRTGQKVTIVFENPDKSWSISFQGTVVRTNPEGMGVQFFSPLSEKIPLWLLEMEECFSDNAVSMG